MSEPMYEWTLRHRFSDLVAELDATTMGDAKKRLRLLGFPVEYMSVVSIKQKPPAVCDCAERRQALRDLTRMTEDLGLYEAEQTAQIDCSNCSQMFDPDDDRADDDVCPACVRWIEWNRDKPQE